MPASLSSSLNINLKSLRLTAFFLLCPLLFFAQSLTGLWTGVLSNDSNTVRKDQSFEIELTEYRGKVYGYSRSEFIVNDTLYYILKRVKGTIEGDVCEVKDDEIVSYNFPTRLDKGIKVTSTFYRNKNDSAWYLAGTWKTNATKKYYTVTGKVDLEEEKDLNASKIFPHLEELKLADEIAFYKDRKTGPPIVKIAKPEKRTEPSPVYNDIASIPDQSIIQKAVPINGPAQSTALIVATSDSKKPDSIITSEIIPGIEVVKTEQPEKLPVIKEPAISSAKRETKNIVPTTKTEIVAVPNKNNTITHTEPLPVEISRQSSVGSRQDPPVVKTQPATTTKQENIISKKPETKNVPVTKASVEPKKTETVPAGKINTAIATVSVTEKKEIKTEPVAIKVTPEINKSVSDITIKATLVEGRRSDFSQEVNFKSDSLQLSLYDNGEIDGDTVSVFMNGEVIMYRQGLKASAIKKTIYITPGNEDFTLVLFAENLGKYPPNTGLLVVRDGEDVYNLRFSSDFQKNAGIVFRKKK